MLKYRDLYNLLRKNPDILDQNVSIWDSEDEECYPVENTYINGEDSPTSDILDEGHLVLTIKTTENVYKSFAATYANDFIEVMIEGCTGGLYNDVIICRDGVFEITDVTKFVRFKHVDKDYSEIFNMSKDHLLIHNPKEICIAMLEVIKHNKDIPNVDHYSENYPELYDNFITSLSGIVGVRNKS